MIGDPTVEYKKTELAPCDDVEGAPMCLKVVVRLDVEEQNMLRAVRRYFAQNEPTYSYPGVTSDGPPNEVGDPSDFALWFTAGDLDATAEALDRRGLEISARLEQVLNV